MISAALPPASKQKSVWDKLIIRKPALVSPTFSGTVFSPVKVPTSVPALSAFTVPGCAKFLAHMDPPVLVVEHKTVQDDLGAGRDPVLVDQVDAVLLPFHRDGPLGKQSQVLTHPELRNH